MPTLWWRPPALGFFAAFAWTASVYPLAGTWLAGVLFAYAGLLCWRPQLWLLLLPALLPVLDLAPVTGWFFLEEIDLLLLLTAGFAYWHYPRANGGLPRWPLLFRVSLALLALAVAIGLWRGLQPLPAVDANTFNNYLSPANALRVGKAWVWALVLLPPLRHAAGPQLDGLHKYLLPGMMLGLLMVTAAAIRERWQFTGLLNFSSDYRISAPFSAMHTGGAALDGYLALSIPLLAVWLLARNAALRNIGALLLLSLAWYVALATFSRGLYLALAAAVAIFITKYLIRRHALRVVMGAVCVLVLLEIAFRIGGYRAFLPAAFLLGLLTARCYRRHRPAVLAGMMLLAAAVPISHGDYVNMRFAYVERDWSTRMKHWQNVLGLGGGKGYGVFPRAYYWHNPQREQLPSYQFIDQDSNRHLRLWAGQYNAGYGELLRILQGVQIAPRQQYLLGIDVRNDGPPGFLHVYLCQRQLLYPQNCVVAPLRQIPHTPVWQRYVYPLQSGPLGGDGLPVKLEIAAEGQQAVLDIDNISLRAIPHGHELLRNGSFSDANNHWFFSSDRSHLPWHIKNLALNLYFEMGWLGLSAYGLLLFSAAGMLLKRGDAAWLAALAAFQVVGLFDSLLDVPRITLLSMLLLCAAALQAKETPS